MKLVNKMQGLVDRILHNSVCWSCGLEHSGQKLICAACCSAIKVVIKPCLQCGLSHKSRRNICVHCLSKPKLWQQMIAPLSYNDPISQLIQQLKYHQKLEALSALMELVLPTFKNLSEQPDLLIPVPLHQNRYIERGFNQSFEITLMLSKALNIAHNDHLVERVVDTQRQSELSLKKRENNIKNAFLVDKKLSDYSHVVIVDDVITSGSTVQELVKQCLKLGVKRVDVWALARTELSS